jgi:DUF218 domain-containing protein
MVDQAGWLGAVGCRPIERDANDLRPIHSISCLCLINAFWNLQHGAVAHGNGSIRSSTTLKPGKHTWGIWQRRECLIPTLRGWILLLFLGAALIALGVNEAHTFLTVNDPVPSDMLVIEGWIPDYVLQERLAEFTRDHYRKILVTGGPITSGAYLCGYTNWAELGAATLLRFGVDTNIVEALPAARVSRDRTFASAVALRAWLRRHHIDATSLNIMTMADHSRRSRLLFTKALGRDYHVGIISMEPQDYDPNRWWKSSEGVRTVVGEMLAYGYARFLFWPSPQTE